MHNLSKIPVRIHTTVYLDISISRYIHSAWCRLRYIFRFNQFDSCALFIGMSHYSISSNCLRYVAGGNWLTLLYFWWKNIHCKFVQCMWIAAFTLYHPIVSSPLSPAPSPYTFIALSLRNYSAAHSRLTIRIPPLPILACTICVSAPFTFFRWVFLPNTSTGNTMLLGLVCWYQNRSKSLNTDNMHDFLGSPPRHSYAPTMLINSFVSSCELRMIGQCWFRLDQSRMCSRRSGPSSIPYKRTKCPVYYCYSNDYLGFEKQSMSQSCRKLKAFLCCFAYTNKD